MKKTFAIKNLILISFCMSFFYGTPCFADEIEKIRGLYAEINKTIEEGSAKEVILHLTSKGWKKFAKAKIKSDEDLDLIESAKVYLMNGRPLKSIMTVASPSGDWESTSDYYFYENEKTAFIFESYLTYQGYNFDKEEDLPPGPYVIEKRVYFNEKGQEIKSITKSFIKSSKKEIPLKYLKKNQFDIYTDVKSLPFYNLLH